MNPEVEDLLDARVDRSNGLWRGEKEKVPGTYIDVSSVTGEESGAGSFRDPGTSLFNSHQTPPDPGPRTPDVAGTIILAGGCPWLPSSIK